MPIGTVKFFNESKGYGFIQPDGGGSDAFVHVSAVERAGMRSIRENQRLSFDLEQDNRGKTSAVNLLLVESERTPEPDDQTEDRQLDQVDEQAERAR